MEAIKPHNRNGQSVEPHVPALRTYASLPPARSVGAPAINPHLHRFDSRQFRPREARPAPANVRLEAARIRKRGILVGTDRQDGQRLYMDPRYLATHLHVLGLTGSGKTRWLGWLFRLLAADPRHTIILIDPKGDLFHLAKRLAVADGLTKRLVLFDLGDPAYRLGFNPLRPNGLPEFTHAKAVRESIRSAWGQADFFQTPQLARFLFLSLAVARFMEFDLVQALQILTPLSPLRKAVLPKLKDPYLKGSLQYLDKLPERRQDELVAPCLARLEAFVMDSMIRDLLTKPSPVLDIAEVIERRQILLVNASKYRPMRKDDCSLLLRMLVNDIVIKAFERPEGKRSPVILIADEVHNLATFDFCQILDEGRSLGLWTVLAHQFLQQLCEEERSGYLFHSVMADARTKVLFNALPEDIEAMAKGVFLDQWDPWLVKDEMDTLETAYREERRLSRSAGRSGSQGRSCTRSEGTSEADSVSETEGRSWETSRGGSQSWGMGWQQGQSFTHTQGRAHTLTEGRSHTDTLGTSHTTSDGETTSTMDSVSDTESQGDMRGWSSSHGTGATDADAGGVTRTWDRQDRFSPIPSQYARSAHHTNGRSQYDLATESGSQSRSASRSVTHADGHSVQHSESQTLSQSHADTYSESMAHTESESDAHTRSFGLTRTQERGISWSQSEGGSQAHTQGHTTTRSQGLADGTSEEEGWNEGVTESPFLAPYQRRVPSLRNFLTWDEYSLTCVRDVIGQETGQAVVKFPLLPAAFLDVPWYAEPMLTRKALARADERIRATIAGSEVVEGAVVEGEVVPEPAPLPMPQPRVSESTPLLAEDDEDLQPVRFWRDCDTDA